MKFWRKDTAKTAPLIKVTDAKHRTLLLNFFERAEEAICPRFVHTRAAVNKTERAVLDVGSL